MSARTRALMALAAIGLLALGAAGPAFAKGRKLLQPLRQYVVSGKITSEQLARSGYDLHEASVTGKKGRFFIVATSTQARRLDARKGVTVRTLRGRTVARTAAVAAPSPLADPTHGYNVFRPWSLKPAACPGTCATPLKPLKDYYQDLARANPDVVKRVKIGESLLGQDIVAYKVTRDARDLRDGARPAVLYDGVQHAREWIAAEMQRRLFTYVVQNKRNGQGQNVRGLLNQRELWFVPIVNPDGYDYTFQSAATRLWRKNLHDNNGDGAITNVDGVDTNRNWPDKWNWDREGSSANPASETYHGTGAASEPEVQAARTLIRRVKPKFLIDFHSFAQLILYPLGWQVETPSTDEPLHAALAGDDDEPAVPGFDPDVSSELYTTNGDITDDAYTAYGVQAFTVELDGGSGPAVGGTDGSDPHAYTPGGFVFQDSDADIQAEFEKNIPFALDLARSAKRPDRPVSHLGNTAPDFAPTTFPLSYGSPQTVEVNAKRSVGDVKVRWQINDGRTRTASTEEFEGGDRYGEPGVYYHRLRGEVTGTSAGDKVRVWFTAKGGRQSASFTYTAKLESDNPVLLLAAEDYTGNSGLREATPYAGPRYLDTYAKALRDAGIGYDVYDVDARGRTAPSNLGVFSHYKAVVWETGDDLYVRTPGQPGGTGTAKLFDDEILAARDYMNEGGKLLVAGKVALQGSWDQFLYNPLGPTPPLPFCNSNQTLAQDITSDDPEGQLFNCVGASNDFQQYWLGAYLPITLDPATPLVAVPPLGSTEFGLDPADAVQNLYSFLTTSSVLPPDEYPQFESDQAIKVNGPPAFDPPTGTQYLYSGQADSSYKRLTRTVDLTAATTGALQFKLSAATEQDFDYVFVEAHTVGQDNWTTLPAVDENGEPITSDDTGAGCPDGSPFWLNENPFLGHYITRSPDPAGGFACAPNGTSGTWNAFTGNSAGFQDWNVDLSAYAGQQVEVSITYASDPGVQGLGVFLDDVKVLANGATVAETSFEDDLGGWAVPGSPPENGVNANDWERTASVGFVDGPGVRTDHSLYWGFGLEGVTDPAKRAELIKGAMTSFGVSAG